MSVHEKREDYILLLSGKIDVFHCSCGSIDFFLKLNLLSIDAGKEDCEFSKDIRVDDGSSKHSSCTNASLKRSSWSQIISCHCKNRVVQSRDILEEYTFLIEVSGNIDEI